MIRQPRAARATGTCAKDNMTPLYTFRLFIISLIIATTIIESPVSAIALGQRPGQISHQDTGAEASTLEEARNDSATVSTITDAVQQIANTTSAKVFEIKGDSSVKENLELTTAYILLKTDAGYLKITGLPIYTSSVKDTEATSSQETTNLPDSTNSFNDIEEKSGVEELSTADEFTRSITHNTKIRSSDLTTQESPIEITIDATTLDKNAESVDNTMSVTKSNEELTKSDDSTMNETNAIKSISDDSTLSETKTTESILVDSTLSESKATESISGDSTLSETKATELISLTTLESTDTTSQSSIATNDETNENNTLTPSWKKYTNIDRKRVDPQMNTFSTEQDEQTTPTRISLEKLLTDTSISSLGQLGESLSSKVTYAFDISSTSPFVQETVRDTPEETTTSSATISQRTLQITSKRAGFLDISAKPVAEETTTIIENYDTPDKINESRGFSSMFEFEPEDSVSEKNNSKQNLASRSQLAEDVMREEMMKEEMLSNEQENAHRYREIDQLSVKPIDKNSLYSVGPNYKPMKKLDVQAAKPFIRNPDDLSWRNESISSLGIVFKAKPAAKNFTEVLKNKTETLFNNPNDKDSKNDLPDLRERLEKIAEVRKSKKKKVVDKFGETIYTDYEESSHSAEMSNANNSEPITTDSSTKTSTTTEVLPTVTTIKDEKDEPDLTTQTYLEHVFDATPFPETETTKQPSKLKNDYYDADDYDGDYLNFPKIELKKFTTQLTSKQTPITSSPFATSPFQKPSAYFWPDRKPTLQYFPPRPNTQKINIQTLDENPVNKLNYYSVKETTKNLIPVSVRYTTLPAPPQISNVVFGQKNKLTTPLNKYTNDLTKTVYYTQPRAADHGYVDDGHYNRPTYVIKHFKDLVEKASKTEDEKDTDYDVTETTQRPGRGTTVGETLRNDPKLNLGEDYDYDAGFRKDVINRFVDNFNQNSERFKVDFPILYNNSVVHRKEEEDGSEWATSSAFMKRLYEDMAGRGRAGRGCAGCERSVELPPEYELHYFVPEQEEGEEAESQAVYKYLWGHERR